MHQALGIVCLFTIRTKQCVLVHHAYQAMLHVESVRSDALSTELAYVILAGTQTACTYAASCKKIFATSGILTVRTYQARHSQQDFVQGLCHMSQQSHVLWTGGRCSANSERHLFPGRLAAVVCA